MAEEYNTLTPDEIRTIVAEVVDSYYHELVDYLSRMFREKDLHIDQVLAEAINIKFALNEHRKVESDIKETKESVIGIKQEMDCIEKAIRDLDTHLPAYYDTLAKRIGEVIVERIDVVWQKYWENIPPYVKWYYKAHLNYLAGIWGVEIPKEVLTDDPGWNPLQGLLDWLGKIADAISRFPELVTNFVNYVANFFKIAWDSLTGFIGWIWNEVQYLSRDPLGWLRTRIVDPIWSGLTWLGERIWEGMQWLGGKLVDFGKWLWEKLQEFGATVFEAMKKVGEGLWNAFRAGAEWAWNTFFVSPYRAMIEGIKNIVREVFTEALSSGGEKGEIWIYFALPLRLMPFALPFTAPFYFISEVSEFMDEMEGEISLKLFGLGGAGKLKMKLGKLIKWLGELGKDITKKMIEGFALGLGLSLLDPLKLIIRPSARAFFTPVFNSVLGVDAFFELPSESKIDQFLQRALPHRILLALGGREVNGQIIITDEAGEVAVTFTPYLKWEEAKEYVSKILRVYGLPEKFLEIYRISEDAFSISFVDRFGKQRTIPLLPFFELPTHSEMLRMTQKDIFPGVDVTQAVASLRGWTPDITVMSYLLTFKYPSFEKLWQFYMRAISGMLWFHLDKEDPVRKVFAKEAENIGAGIPISPYEIQKAIALKNSLGVKAFETAISTYFKWLEYSNFSWFTKETKMYGIRIGEEVVGTLGGWTADSWIMADVAADIPGKIDMRWMSRYGIFELMSKRFEDKGIKFESFAPMVDAVKYLVDTSEASAIKVSLKWFSKLLQATGLHPAWVPIVTVAENVMAIADEMTLLRTGWINLFKEGLLDFAKMEKALSGLIVVSYEVGYFDTAEKTWKKGWVNLPVRWLPHERRLLALRALMDRFLDLFREYYGALRRLVGKNIIKPEAFEAELKTFVSMMIEQFYKPTLSGILGVDVGAVPKEMLPEFEKGYLEVWKYYVNKLYEEEQVERARIYLRYVVSRFIERTAMGFVTADEFKEIVNVLKEKARITDVEVEMFDKIIEYLRTYYIRDLKFEAIISKFRRMRITREELKEELRKIGIPEEMVDDIIDKHARTYTPSLSQIATIAEIVPEVLSIKVGDKPYYLFMIEWFDLTDVEKQIWMKYIERKPYRDDINKVVTNIRALLSYGASIEPISKVVGKDIKEWLAGYGVDEKEWEILKILTTTDEYERVWREAYLSTSRLISFAEFIPEALDWLVEHLKKYNIPDSTIEKWRRYAFLKSISAEVSLLRSRFIELISKGASEKVILGALGLEAVEKLAEYGISKAEREILVKVGKIERLKDIWSKFALTPELMAGHVELMPNNIGAVVKALEEAGLPKEAADYWRTYLWRKHVSGDFTYVRTAMRSLLEKGIDITKYDWVKIYEEGKKLYEKLANFLSMFGVTADEFGLWYVTAFAETLVPKELTISFIATLSEFVPIPEEWVEEVLEWYRIPERWHTSILHYVKAKPLKDELLRLRSALIKSWVKGVDLGEYGRRALELLMAYGWTDKEIEVLRLAADLERIIDEQVERWPTVSEIVTIAEVVPEVRKFLDRVLEARKLPPELRPYYKRYVLIKPWYDELKSLVSEVITDYAKGKLTDEDMKSFLEWLKHFGFEDEEIKFIYTLAALRKKRYGGGSSSAGATTTGTATKTATKTATGFVW